METVSINLASMTRDDPDIKAPEWIDNPFPVNSVSKCRDLQEELRYYLKRIEHVEGSKLFDNIHF